MLLIIDGVGDVDADEDHIDVAVHAAALPVDTDVEDEGCVGDVVVDVVDDNIVVVVGLDAGAIFAIVVAVARVHYVVAAEFDAAVDDWVYNPNPLVVAGVFVAFHYYRHHVVVVVVAVVVAVVVVMAV